MKDITKKEMSQLKEDIINLIAESDPGMTIEELAEQIILATHSFYTKKELSYNVEVISSPFDDEELTKHMAYAYAQLVKDTSMSELVQQQDVVLDFRPHPLTRLTIGFSKFTLSFLEATWKRVNNPNPQGKPKP